MILNREQRKRLFAGEAIELRFPATQPCPVRFDAVYTIETDKRGKDGQKLPSQGHFRVLVVRKRGEEWVAAAKYEGDPVRLLAKVAEYTDYEGRALEGEPEAVDEMTQQRLTKEAGSRAGKRSEEAQLLRERNSIEARIGIARKVASVKGVDIGTDLRAMERRLIALERKLDERKAA